VQGPAPLYGQSDESRYKNCPTGYVEETNLNSFVFDQQYHSFHNRGYAVDPSAAYRSHSSINYVGTPTHTLRTSRPKRKAKGDPGTQDYLGPWAPFHEETAPAQLVRYFFSLSLSSF